MRELTAMPPSFTASYPFQLPLRFSARLSYALRIGIARLLAGRIYMCRIYMNAR